MSNVVKMRKQQILPTVSHGNLADIDVDYTRAVRAFVNGLVRDYVMKKGKLNSLALRAKLSNNTVSRLAYYETARPQWHTVMAVIMALDAMPEFAQLTMRWVNQNPTDREK